MSSTNDRTTSPHETTQSCSAGAATGVGGNEVPSLAAIVATTVPRTPLELRARLLRRLLMPIGPMALTVLAGGTFAKYVEFARWSRISVSLDDAARVTASQTVELVNYVEQSNPTVLEQVMVMLSRDTTTMATLGASVAAIATQLASHRKSRNLVKSSKSLPHA